MAILTVILFIVILSALVVAHEFGHYMAARKAGMKIEEFGVGFPPRLFAWKDARGTDWSINLIPLGGFVKIFGENGHDAELPGSFASKSIPWRFLTLSGGVLMNFIVAALLFAFGFAVGLPAVIEDAPAGAKVSDISVSVLQVLPDSPAATAGILEGDAILTIDGAAVLTGEEARVALTPKADGSPLSIDVRRAGEVQTFLVQPAFIEEVGREAVGVGVLTTGTVRYPWYLVLPKGIEAATVMTIQVVQAFGGLIAGLVQRENVAAELSGPVGIAVMTGQVASLGFSHLVQFAAMLSINLAVLNALPFPALDGGRIAFLFLEAVRRKRASARFEQGVHAAGFAFLLLLVVFVTYRDLVKLFF
ncbi:RIP metalloprotease RseP [Patescibacteria group bacterium]|nr:RIP metalloprotease RseP [Patescibacteria group bacterium]